MAADATHQVGSSHPPVACDACQAPAQEEVLLCAGCLVRSHVGCWHGVCFRCDSSAAPIGPVRATGKLIPSHSFLPLAFPTSRERRWRLRRGRVLLAGAALGAAGWLLSPGEERPPQRATVVFQCPPAPVVIPTPVIEVAPPAPVTRHDPLAWRGAANDRCRAGDHAGALAMLDELAEDHEFTHHGRHYRMSGRSNRYGRAIELTHVGDLVGAEREYSALLESNPRDTASWISRSWVRGQLGKHRESWADADRALALEDHAYAWQNRAWARLHLDDLAGAQADVERALALDPENAQAWETRARLHLKLGRHAEAASDLAAAREHDHWRERAAALDDLARELALAASRERCALGHHAEALLEVDRGLGVARADARLWFARATELAHQHDHRGQVAALDRVLALDPSHAAAWNNRGCARNELGDHAGALADCTRALELQGSEAYPLNNRARARLHLGDLAGAEDDLSRSLARDAKNAWAWETLAMLRLAQGRVEEAKVALGRAYELDRKGERTASLDRIRGELGL